MSERLIPTAPGGLVDRLERLGVAFDAVDTSSMHDPLPRLLHIAAAQLAAAADADCAAISRLHENSLVDVVTFDPTGNLADDEAYLVGDYPATRTVLVTRTPATASVDDPASDGAEVRLLREFGLSSVLMLPLVNGPYTWGLAEAYRGRTDPFSAEDIAAARLFTAHLGSLLLRYYER